jgi:hypothetical protein
MPDLAGAVVNRQCLNQSSTQRWLDRRVALTDCVDKISSCDACRSLISVAATSRTEIMMGHRQI